MTRRDFVVFGVIVVGAGVGLWVVRDTVGPYSGLVAAWVALILVFVTTVYVRQVALQAKFAQETVEEMKRQHEMMYRPALLIRLERGVERKEFIAELGVVLDNQASVSAINITLWAHHTFLDYGPKRYIAAIAPLDKSDGNELGVEGELAPAPPPDAMTIADAIVTVVAEYQGIDGREWYSTCGFLLDEVQGIACIGMRVGLPGRYKGQESKAIA